MGPIFHFTFAHDCIHLETQYDSAKERALFSLACFFVICTFTSVVVVVILLCRSCCCCTAALHYLSYLGTFADNSVLILR